MRVEYRVFEGMPGSPERSIGRPLSALGDRLEALGPYLPFACINLLAPIADVAVFRLRGFVSEQPDSIGSAQLGGLGAEVVEFQFCG